jgi:hypothetical protein
VFSGDNTTVRFGRGAAQIGDIDHDGREDIAIAATGAQPKIFIYKGRANWPLTMGPTDADYVITPDNSYNGSSLGVVMARLGDFNGDGVDDFVVGASGFTVGGSFGVGRVLIVLGSSSFGSITLPDTTNTITITGDSSLSLPLFGAGVVGLGHFYSVSAGTTLVVSAPGTAATNSNSGRVYAFHGQAGSGGTIALSSADHVFTGPAGNATIGAVLSNLGTLIDGSPSLGTGQPLDVATSPGTTGSGYVFSGTSASGPFASRVMFIRSTGGRTGDALFGGGVSGRNASYSLLGDAQPDFGLVSQSGSSFVLVDGNVVAGMGAGPTDASTVATATVKVPTGWVNTGVGEAQLFPDLNGDGYSDFALGSAINAVPGSLAVYW